MSNPSRITGCAKIKDQCGQPGCTQRPVGVASVPVFEDPTQIDFLWACDDHVAVIQGILADARVDPALHCFEVSRTCRAGGNDGPPCGGAGDYLAYRADGREVITICRRHMQEWRPDTAAGSGA